MRKITARIVHFFIESKVIDETDQEIYEYGLEILSENVMLTVFLILFGVAIGRGVETGIFLFSFCWLRRFCGGYHAKTKRGCHIATFITYIVFLIELYITFFLSFYILSNVRKALFYRLYGHFYFLFTFAYRGISSYVFPLKRGKFRGKYFYAIRRFISVLALSIEECAYQSIVILILE